MTSYVKVTLSFIVVVIATIVWRAGVHRQRQLECEHGLFSLPGMKSCHMWLTCEDMNDVKVIEEIGQGAVKVVYLAKWKGHTVVLNQLKNQAFHEDFQHGLQMLKIFQPHPRFIKLIGYCHHRHGGSVVTEYHQFGAALNLNSILTSPDCGKNNTLKTRFQLCVDYVQILDHLHNGTSQTRIMCDSNSLEKTLHQYLISSDLRLIVNDLDALPVVDNANNVTAVCGHREILGDFVAPEQLWPFDDSEFEDGLMPGYDEKTDIWKVPDMCEYFLGEYPRVQSLKFHLFRIHKQCKSISPSPRPTSHDILLEYQRLWRDLNIENENTPLEIS